MMNGGCKHEDSEETRKVYHHRHRHYYHHPSAATANGSRRNELVATYYKRSNPSKRCLAQSIALNNEVGVIMVAILSHNQPPANNWVKSSDL
jgi:hypothetical protein